MVLTSYHTDKVMLIWNDVNINGFAGDSFIEVERNGDTYTTHSGTSGEICRTKNADRSGKITVTLMASAPVNDTLAALAQSDEETGQDYAPILFKDLNGKVIVSGSEAWVTRRPKIDRAKESGTIQWVFEVAAMSFKREP